MSRQHSNRLQAAETVEDLADAVEPSESRRRPPRVFKRLDDWRRCRRSLQGTIGFVATMGALHDGHGSLIERSVAENDYTVLSIYLNPTQFNNPEDLDCYPNTLERDLQLACQLGVDFVVTPGFDEMYADDYRFQVDENRDRKSVV